MATDTHKLEPAKKRRSGHYIPKTDKARRTLADKILTLYTEGGIDDDGNAIKYTFTSCCESVGISHRSFYNWTAKDAIIAKALKEAQTHNAVQDTKDLSVRATQGLVSLTQGRFVEETTETVEQTLNAKGKITGSKVKKDKKMRFIPPNAIACIFIKKNADPEHFNEELQNILPGEEQVFKIGGQEIKF